MEAGSRINSPNHFTKLPFLIIKLAGGYVSVFDCRGHFSFFLATKHLNPLPTHLGNKHMTWTQPFKNIQPRVVWAMSNSTSSGTGQNSWGSCDSAADGVTSI